MSNAQAGLVPPIRPFSRPPPSTARPSLRVFRILHLRAPRRPRKAGCALERALTLLAHSRARTSGEATLSLDEFSIVSRHARAGKRSGAGADGGAAARRARVDTPILLYTCWMWWSAVFIEMKSRWAICFVVIPFAARRRTSTSRRESAPGSSAVGRWAASLHRDLQPTSSARLEQLCDSSRRSSPAASATENAGRSARSPEGLERHASRANPRRDSLSLSRSSCGGLPKADRLDEGIRQSLEKRYETRGCRESFVGLSLGDFNDLEPSVDRTDQDLRIPEQAHVDLLQKRQNLLPPEQPRHGPSIKDCRAE